MAMETKPGMEPLIPEPDMDPLLPDTGNDAPWQMPATPPAPRQHFRAEWILIIIVLVLLAALIALTVLCLPYMGKGAEDPQAPPRQEQTVKSPAETQAHDCAPEVIVPEETEPEPEPEPTIPPEAGQLQRCGYLRFPGGYRLAEGKGFRH